MRELPLVAGPEHAQFVASLRAGQLDTLVVLTGVGFRALVEVVAGLISAEEFAGCLRGLQIVTRGPKSTAALKPLGLRPSLEASEPYTWRQVLETLLASGDLAGRQVAVQQYGVRQQGLFDALEGAGAAVREVGVYRWDLPEDTGPLERSIGAIVAGKVDMALFTAGPQLDQLLRLARRLGAEQDLRAALPDLVVGSIGASCSEALIGLGVTPDFESERGKMGAFVKAAALYWAERSESSG